MPKLISKLLKDSAYFRDILWQATGNTSAQLIGIVAMPVLTRVYGPEGFASWSLFKEIVAGIAIIMTLRLEYLVMLPGDDKSAESLAKTIVRLAAIQTAVWTPLLLSLYFFLALPAAIQPVEPWLWLAPITAAAISLSVTWQQLVQRKGAFKLTGFAELIGRCWYVFSGLLGAVLLPSPIGLMGAMFLGALGKLLWLARGGVDVFRAMTSQAAFAIETPIRRLALSMSCSSAIALVSGVVPLLFIGHQYGVDALGQYGLVVSTLYLPSSVLGQAIGQVFYQRAAKLHAEGEPFRSLLLDTSRHLLKVGAPLFLSVSILSPWLYPMVFGGKWALAGEMARIMSAAALVSFVSTAVDRSSLIANVWWYLTAWHTLRAIVMVLTAVVCQSYELGFLAFVGLISLQGVVAYMLDWCCSLAFSNRAKKS